MLVKILNNEEMSSPGTQVMGFVLNCLPGTILSTHMCFLILIGYYYCFHFTREKTGLERVIWLESLQF